VEREGVADHVAGEARATLCIVGFNADLVVDGETGVAPVAHAPGQVRIEAAFGAQKRQYFVP